MGDRKIVINNPRTDPEPTPNHIQTTILSLYSEGPVRPHLFSKRYARVIPQGIAMVALKGSPLELDPFNNSLRDIFHGKSFGHHHGRSVLTCLNGQQGKRYNKNGSPFECNSPRYRFGTIGDSLWKDACCWHRALTTHAEEKGKALRLHS